MTRSVWTFVAVSFAALSLVACSQLTAPQAGSTPELQTQALGTTASDGADDLAVNQKLQAVFLTGTTNGALDGPKGGEQSLPNIFVRRYTRSGGVVWRKQLDTSYRDFGASIANDPSGNVVVGGYQQRPGELSYMSKGLLYKFSGSGTLLWSRLFQVEVGGRLTDTEVRAVAADAAGNIYVTGDTDIDTNNTDPGATFVRKYSSGGTVLWSRVFNVKEIFPYSDELALDASGNAYVLSYINSDGYDLPKNEPTYLTKVSASGQLLFHKRFSSAEAPRYLQVVGNTLYVSGTKRYFNAGGDVFETDALFAAYDLNGTKRWDKTFGTTKVDAATSLSVDAQGNLFIGGNTAGSLAGTAFGKEDFFIRKYSPSRSVVFTKQFGSAAYDALESLVVYGSNELYLAGSTQGKLAGGTSHGNYDAFLRRSDGNGTTVWTDQ